MKTIASRANIINVPASTINPMIVAILGEMTLEPHVHVQRGSRSRWSRNYVYVYRGDDQLTRESPSSQASNWKASRNHQLARGGPMKSEAGSGHQLGGATSSKASRNHQLESASVTRSTSLSWKTTLESTLRYWSRCFRSYYIASKALKKKKKRINNYKEGLHLYGWSLRSLWLWLWLWLKSLLWLLWLRLWLCVDEHIIMWFVQGGRLAIEWLAISTNHNTNLYLHVDSAS